MPVKLWCELGKHFYDHYTSHNTVKSQKKSCDECKYNETKIKKKAKYIKKENIK